MAFFTCAGGPGRTTLSALNERVGMANLCHFPHCVPRRFGSNGYPHFSIKWPRPGATGRGRHQSIGGSNG